jgi:hypothetical protein
MSHNRWIDEQVNSDFSKARRESYLRSAVNFLRQEPSTLLPFEEVRSRINIRGQHDRGHQTVPLDAIVGSEGRYADFDRMFLPRHEVTKERWKNVDRAHYQEVPLPPIDLYKIGDVYFVRDGNHRVSVAKQQGQHYIDAHVIELDSDIRLQPDLTTDDLGLLEERSDFLEWTNLAKLRPDQDIVISQAGGYLDMIRHINGHRYFKCLEQGEEPTAEEAVISWYDTIYLPLVEAIARTGVLAAFPGRTPADLYLWIMDHRYYLTQNEGFDPGAQEAALDYTRQYGEKKGKLDLPPAASKAEREFLTWSYLGRLRPSVRIPLSDDDDYIELRQHILHHQYYMGKNLGREVNFEEASQSWYDTVYEPVVQAVIGQHITDQFPRQQLGDLYLWITQHLHYQRGQGIEIEPAEAARQYAERFGKERASLLMGVLHRARRLMRLAVAGF